MRLRIDPRTRSQGSNQEFDQSEGALIGLEQVPAAVDNDRRKWLLLSQHIVERIPHSGKLRRSELGFVPNRSEPRSDQQLIVLAQRYIERRREPGNVARAEIVDEGALYDALSRRSIAGAALDVWYRYPREVGPAAPATRPFHELPNVLMTPHISGWTDGMLDARAKLIAENIRRVAARETPLNLIA